MEESLGNLIVAELIRKGLTYYGPGSFITMFTRSHYWIVI
jgi:hypothetical protein